MNKVRNDGFNVICHVTITGLGTYNNIQYWNLNLKDVFDYKVDRVHEFRKMFLYSSVSPKFQDHRSTAIPKTR